MRAAEDAGLRVLGVDVGGRLDLGAVVRMRGILRDGGFDVVHTHDFASDLYALLASAGMKVKRVATAHGSTRDSLLKRGYLFFDEWIVYRFYDRIVTVSEDLRGQLTSRGVADGKIAVVRNGLDIETLAGPRKGLSSEEPIRIPEGHAVFSVVGRLFPDKGHRFFLEAFAAIRRRHPLITALIVGDGPHRDAIAGHIAALGLEDLVVMCGVRTDMQYVYGLTDVLVIPSLREGLPYTLLEAMASRLLVVATAVGDIPAVVEDGVTGLLVPPGDAAALEAAMEKLLQGPDGAVRMGERAFDRVTTAFSGEQMARETEAVYSILATGRVAET